MAKVRLSESEEKIVVCLKRGELMGISSIAAETGLTYSEVNNSIVNLTNKIPIYEDTVNGTSVYGLLY